MILTNAFVVEAPVARVWGLLDRLEDFVACMPGATYVGRDGDDHKANIKVKIGVISLNFQGTMRVVARDQATHTDTISGAGKDSGGKASATATFTAHLEALAAARTRVEVKTDLALTGRVAQFGGGLIADIASRMVAQFSDNLNRAIMAEPDAEAAAGTSAGEPAAAASSEQAPPAPSPAPPRPAAEPAALDLGSVMGPVLARRALTYVVGPAVFFILGWLVGKCF
ncbi:MAG: SRPBCC family protein [Variibacter sp.]|nr:SRPBCC family protein [Variibacter sp.]